jgi:hypothetical protein
MHDPDRGEDVRMDIVALVAGDPDLVAADLLALLAQDGHNVHRRATGLGHDEDLGRAGALVAGEVVHHDRVAAARRGDEPKPLAFEPGAGRAG